MSPLFVYHGRITSTRDTALCSRSTTPLGTTISKGPGSDPKLGETNHKRRSNWSALDYRTSPFQAGSTGFTKTIPASTRRYNLPHGEQNPPRQRAVYNPALFTATSIEMGIEYESGDAADPTPSNAKRAEKVIDRARSEK